MGELATLDSSGDTKVIWSPDRPAEVEEARRTFDNLRAKGYSAFKVTAADGSKGEEIRAFDPALEKIIMAPRMQGGQ